MTRLFSTMEETTAYENMHPLIKNEITDKDTQIEELQEENNQLECELSDSQTRIDELEAEIAALDEKIEKLTSKIDR